MLSFKIDDFCLLVTFLTFGARSSDCHPNKQQVQTHNYGEGKTHNDFII